MCIQSGISAAAQVQPVSSTSVCSVGTQTEETSFQEEQLHASIKYLMTEI